MGGGGGGPSRHVGKPPQDFLLNAAWFGSVIRDMPEGRIPFADESFDVVVNNQVMEHVENMEVTLAELHLGREAWRCGAQRVSAPRNMARRPLRSRLLALVSEALGGCGCITPRYAGRWGSAITRANWARSAPGRITVASIWTSRPSTEACRRSIDCTLSTSTICGTARRALCSAALRRTFPRTVGVAGRAARRAHPRWGRMRLLVRGRNTCHEAPGVAPTTSRAQIHLSILPWKLEHRVIDARSLALLLAKILE